MSTSTPHIASSVHLPETSKYQYHSNTPQTEQTQYGPIQLLEKLTEHDELVDHLSTILRLFQLNEESWRCTLILWKNTPRMLPQLCQMPSDMLAWVFNLRAIPDFESVRFACVEKVKAGISGTSRPNSYRLSGLSHQSSIRSNATTISNLSVASSQTSQTSTNSIALHLSRQAFNTSNPIQRVRNEHLPDSAHTQASSAAANATALPPSQLVDDRPHKCVLEGCLMKFVYAKALQNHMYNKHGVGIPTTPQPSHDADMRPETIFPGINLEVSENSQQTSFMNPSTTDWPLLSSIPNLQGSMPNPLQMTNESNRVYNNTGVEILSDDVVMVNSELATANFENEPDSQHQNNGLVNAYDPSSINFWEASIS